MSSNNVDAFSENTAFPGGGGGGGGFSTFYGDGLFGDGVDGNATLINVTTLTKETYYNNLTITGTGVLKPAGFRIFVKGTLTIDPGGSINDDGLAPLPGTPGVGGLSLGSRQTLGGNSGAGGPGSSGGNGGVGSASGGSSPLNGSGLAPVGGAGGGAGANLGGAAGAATQPVQGQRWVGTAWQQQGRFNNGTAQAQFNGGSGGGGGAGSVVAATGGGGGSGAGNVWVAAKYIINNGRISANGGNGGPGSGASGAAGGGGGGGGGNVCVGTLSSSYGTIQALGGLGGTPLSTGFPGLNGNAGSVQVVVLS